MKHSPHQLPPDEYEEPVPNESFLSQRPNKKAFYPVFLYAGLCFLFTYLYWKYPELKNDLAGNRESVFGEGKLYLLVTSLLVHSDIRHVLSNMMFFVPFGGLLTFYYGWRMFPLIAVSLGIITQVISLKTYSPYTKLIGSSGVLYVMFGLWLSLFYKVETHFSKPQRWIRLIGFGLIMLVPTAFSPEVSYRTHYIGLLVGVVAGLYYARQHEEEFAKRNFDHWQMVLAKKSKEGD